MKSSGFRAFESETLSSLPRGAGWVHVIADGLSGPGRIVAFIDIIRTDGSSERVCMRRAGRERFDAILFTDASIRSIRLGAFGRLRSPERAGVVELRPIGSLQAATRLFTRPGAWRRLPLRLARPALIKRRLREAEAAIIGDRSELWSYANWLATFATWSEDDLTDLPALPRIAFLVFGNADTAACAATAACLREQGAAAVICGELDWRAAVGKHPDGAEYIGVLQAGEVVVPGGIRQARHALRLLQSPAIAIADEDRVDHEGRRSQPSFRPEPNHSLMLSGTLARGMWLFRRDLLADCPLVDCRWAETLRLETWFRHWENSGEGGRRIPQILVSRRDDTDEAPAEMIRHIVARHLERAMLPFRATASWPVRLEVTDRTTPPSITAIVPSTLVAPHTADCLRSILVSTARVPFDMVIAVAQPDPLRSDQEAVAAGLTAVFPNVRIVHVPMPSFNFAETVNRASLMASGDELLLLNDDVTAIDEDWLPRMSAFLADRHVGIVGARLLYSDGTIQHGGIIMGLAGFCEHANRRRPNGEAGYEWRNILPQQLLAVTGACLLIKRSAWRNVGGMDEGYPSAFNDVDLCLRVNEAGYGVVLADATLIHDELQTYGSHYAGERAAFFAAEVSRMRERWSAEIDDDPFYNPNLDLSPERAWCPAYPPRLGQAGRR